MKFPKEIRVYCPFCKKHVLHKAKVASKGRPRTLAQGNRRHEEKLRGHGGKRAGTKPVKKQGKRQVIVLTCSSCKKKHLKVVGTRTKKRLEIKR